MVVPGKSVLLSQKEGKPVAFSKLDSAKFSKSSRQIVKAKCPAKVEAKHERVETVPAVSPTTEEEDFQPLSQHDWFKAFKPTK